VSTYLCCVMLLHKGPRERYECIHSVCKVAFPKVRITFKHDVGNECGVRAVWYLFEHDVKYPSTGSCRIPARTYMPTDRPTNWPSELVFREPSLRRSNCGRGNPCEEYASKYFTRSDTVDYHTGSLPGAMTTCRRLEHFRFFGAGWGGSLIDTCQQLTGRGL